MEKYMINVLTQTLPYAWYNELTIIFMDIQQILWLKYIYLIALYLTQNMVDNY